MTDEMREAAERFAEPGYRALASQSLERLAGSRTDMRPSSFQSRGRVVLILMKIIFISGIRPMTEEQLS